MVARLQRKGIDGKARTFLANQHDVGWARRLKLRQLPGLDSGLIGDKDLREYRLHVRPIADEAHVGEARSLLVEVCLLHRFLILIGVPLPFFEEHGPFGVALEQLHGRLIQINAQHSLSSRAQ